ncbi:uncharacterized protein LOC105429632 [Pogonomyrmex barbatus]|uniref:Uncharacterized protein LOC105429632 n=1 Tax=Pogonomyrmex barbatus TaxID=144034 RepID=A0A6I9X8W2_9HYME|nr:uncharacterized protein LOC105429632 [Pogonomyrmex barbatus]
MWRRRKRLTWRKMMQEVMRNYRRLREAYVNENRVLKHVNEIDFSQENPQKIRFDENWADNFKVTVKISDGHNITKKNSNFYKILYILKKKNIKLRKSMMLNFRSGMIQFLNATEANAAISKLNEDSPTTRILAIIEERNTFFKGVIPMYAENLVDLFENIMYPEIRYYKNGKIDKKKMG